MDAVQTAQMLSPDGLAQRSRAVGLNACKSAETASKPLQKNAMTATWQRATAAAQGAQWSADTLALDSRLCARLHHVVTETLQALNHATMETLRLTMGAARHVPLKWVTRAITTTAHVLLPSAFGGQVTRLVGMAKLLGQR
jgi:post-segregation antitoxin (ccd killing protein)